MPRRRMFLIGVLIGVGLMVFYQTVTRKNPDDMSAMPAAEVGFVQAAMRASALWNSGANDLAKSEMPAARAAALCKALPGLNADDWTGTIRRVEPIGFPDLAGRKSALVVIALTSRVTVATPAAPLLNDPDNMVEAGSAIYAAAAGLRNGAAVVFSGRFFASGSDCVKEDSLLEDGSMSAPEFKVRLTALRGAK